MELNALESHLWEAANILRGPVGAADSKTYVFPLLFCKRISDVHAEDHAGWKEFNGDEEVALSPKNYRFQVQEDSHWKEVQKVAPKALRALVTKDWSSK